jgi:hypothetical protein
MKHELVFTVEKETKGAIRFAEINPENNETKDFSEAVVGTLYVRKHALDGTPTTIRVTITD